MQKTVNHAKNVWDIFSGIVAHQPLQQVQVHHSFNTPVTCLDHYSPLNLCKNIFNILCKNAF